MNMLSIINTKKYVAKRKDICAGQLLETEFLTVKHFDGKGNQIEYRPAIEDSSYDANTDREFSESENRSYIVNFSAYAGLVCRGMLFSVNENDCAKDLIWTTPTNYTIAGMENSKDINSRFIITEYVELNELLKYLRYGEDLTQSDLRKIYNKFVVSNFWINCHRELFGFKSLGHGMGYGSGGPETIPLDIYLKLGKISSSNNGKPHEHEPNYKQIKRIK